MTAHTASLPATDVASQGDARLARYWPLLVLALMLPIWSIGMFDRGIWTPDEPREYDIAYNMLQSGDLITPRLAGEPFLEKPPLSYWAQSASMRIFGPSIAAARFPNLLWAALTALCIGLLAGDMAVAGRRHQAALIAALATGTTYLAMAVQIWLATDAPLVAMTALALLSMWRLAHAEARTAQLGWSLVLGASLAGAALAKNGFGLLVPGMTILVWFTWERRLRQLLRWPWWLAAGICVLFAGGWLLALARQPGGASLVHAVLWDNLVARFLPVHSDAGYDLGHRNSHWRYLVFIPVFVVPWTFALLAAARWSAPSLRRVTASTSAVRFCVASVVPSCIVLLLSYTSRDVYFSPALLGLPVLLALWFTTQSDNLTQSEQWLLRLTRLTVQVLAALLAILGVLALALLSVPEPASIAVVVLLGAIMFSATRLSLRASPAPMHGVVTAVGMFLVALGTLEALIFPTIDRAQNLRGLVTMAAPQLTGHVATYCADETIRATLDYAIDLRLPNVCTDADVERLLHEHGDAQLLVQLQPAPSKQRIRQLIPALASKDPPGNQRAGEQLTIPADLGLQQTVRWSAPGGRGYALYGRAPPPSERNLPDQL